MTKASRYSSQAMKAEAKWREHGTWKLTLLPLVGTYSRTSSCPGCCLVSYDAQHSPHKKELPGPKCHSVKVEKLHVGGSPEFLAFLKSVTHDAVRKSCPFLASNGSISWTEQVFWWACGSMLFSPLWRLERRNRKLDKLTILEVFAWNHKGMHHNSGCGEKPTSHIVWRQWMIARLQ